MIVPVECKVLPDELIQDNIGFRHARPHILRIIERREDFGTHLGAHLVPNAATGETLAEGSLKLGCGHSPTAGPLERLCQSTAAVHCRRQKSGLFHRQSFHFDTRGHGPAHTQMNTETCSQEPFTVACDVLS